LRIVDSVSERTRDRGPGRWRSRDGGRARDSGTTPWRWSIPPDAPSPAWPHTARHA